MLKSDNTQGLIEQIKLSIKEGTDAFGFQIETLLQRYRNIENYKKILSSMGDRPAYITSYQRGNNNPIAQSDEELTEILMQVFRCGAKLMDIRGDLFDICEGELTMEPKAVQRQKELINAIHEEGGEVLMSSHVLKFIPKEKVLEIALEQQSRGVDIAKIVTAADNQSELDENFEAIMLLKEKVSIKTLFLCNGKYCTKHRVIGPILNESMFLTMENSIAKGAQPSIEKAREIIKLAGYNNLREIIK